MDADSIQVLKGLRRPAAGTPPPSLLVAGATGVLGNEVVRQLAGSHRFGHTALLAREAMRAGMRGMDLQLVPDASPAQWPLVTADTAIVMFDPARLYYDRERALWTPRPEQLPELATWLRKCGAKTVAIVLPHAQGRLPDALKRGLASLDEQAVAAVGFERLLILRTPQKPREEAGASAPVRFARFMLSVFTYMIPSSEQPVRASKVAQLLALALDIAPPGIHIAPPELMWRASQGDMHAAARAWLGR